MPMSAAVIEESLCEAERRGRVSVLRQQLRRKQLRYVKRTEEGSIQKNAKSIQ